MIIIMANMLGYLPPEGRKWLLLGSRLEDGRVINRGKLYASLDELLALRPELSSGKVEVWVGDLMTGERLAAADAARVESGLASLLTPRDLAYIAEAPERAAERAALEAARMSAAPDTRSPLRRELDAQADISTGNTPWKYRD